MDMPGRVAGYLAAVLTVLMVCPASAQEASLRYRWNAGDELRYRFTMQTTTTLTGSPMGDLTTQLAMTQTLSTTVEDVAPDGSATLRLAFLTFRMEISSPLGSKVFDSANPADTDASPDNSPDRMLSNIVSALAGASIVVQSSPNGMVRKVEGLAQIFDRMVASLPRDAATAASVAALKDSMTDEAIGRQLSQGLAQLPDQPVKAGDSWTRQFDMSNPIIGGRIGSTTFTLQALESSGASTVARLSLKTAMTLNADKQSSALAPLKIRFDEGAGEGEQLFDVTRGRLLRSTLRMTTPMTMEGPAPDGSRLSLKSVSKVTTTMELLEK
jgi:hypothetical protein